MAPLIHIMEWSDVEMWYRGAGERRVKLIIKYNKYNINPKKINFLTFVKYPHGLIYNLL